MFPVCKVAAAATIWLCILAGPGRAAEQAPRPFMPGEKLTFDLTWGGMGAGRAELQVLPMTTLGGSAAYHFVLTARSSKTIDRIFRIRDRLESVADLSMTHSLLYRQKIREGGYRKNRVITFDWEKNELTYVSNNSQPRKLALMPGTFDPLGAFYFIRLQPLHELKTVACPITDGKTNSMGRVNILRKETIRVGGRSYATVVLEPILDDVELFNENDSSGVLVWMTADQRRLPVLIESQVIFGSFRAELRSVEQVPLPKTE